jgi:hypothetical protein
MVLELQFESNSRRNFKCVVLSRPDELESLPYIVEKIQNTEVYFPIQVEQNKTPSISQDIDRIVAKSLWGKFAPF